MRQRSVLEILIGAVILCVAAGFLVYAVVHSGRSATGGLALTLRFDRVDGLPLGAMVKVAGVDVGRVANISIDPQTYQALVDVRVDNWLQLRRGTVARILSEGLMGANYVALEPGQDDSVPLLTSGAVISDTYPPVNLNDLIGRVMMPAPGGGTQQ